MDQTWAVRVGPIAGQSAVFTREREHLPQYIGGVGHRTPFTDQFVFGAISYEVDFVRVCNGSNG